MIAILAIKSVRQLPPAELHGVTELVRQAGPARVVALG
jgi:hypothetical protein